METPEVSQVPDLLLPVRGQQALVPVEISHTIKSRWMGDRWIFLVEFENKTKEWLVQRGDEWVMYIPDSLLEMDNLVDEKMAGLGALPLD